MNGHNQVGLEGGMNWLSMKWKFQSKILCMHNSICHRQMKWCIHSTAVFASVVQTIFSLLSLDNKSLILWVRLSTQFLQVSFLDKVSSFVICPLTNLFLTRAILRLGPPLPRPFLDKDGEHDVEGLAAGGDVAEEDNDVGEAERDVVGRDCWGDVAGRDCAGDVVAGEDDLGVGDRGGDDSQHGNILCPVRRSYLEKSRNYDRNGNP